MSVLALKTVSADMTAHGGFLWPEKGAVVCEDWNPEPKCGGGLHSFLWGQGGSLLSTDESAKWLVLEIEDYVDLHAEHNFKIKSPKAYVVFCGKKDEAIQYLLDHGAQDKPVYGCRKMSGDWSTLTGGYGSTLTGGYGSTLTGGDGSTLTGGNGSTLTGGNGSTLTGGNGSTLTGGDWSTLEVKYWDGKRIRREVAYIGEKKIKANTPYKYDTKKKLWLKA